MVILLYDTFCCIIDLKYSWYTEYSHSWQYLDEIFRKNMPNRYHNTSIAFSLLPFLLALLEITVSARHKLLSVTTGSQFCQYCTPTNSQQKISSCKRRHKFVTATLHCLITCITEGTPCEQTVCASAVSNAATQKHLQLHQFI